MAKTEGEKREYNKGYGRAQRRCSDRVTRVLKIARAYRDASIGDHALRCKSCLRWTRGGETTLWGTCKANFEFVAGESNMWTEPKAPIYTQEGFGCINWIPRKKEVPDCASGRAGEAVQSGPIRVSESGLEEVATSPEGEKPSLLLSAAMTALSHYDSDGTLTDEIVRNLREAVEDMLRDE